MVISIIQPSMRDQAHLCFLSTDMQLYEAINKLEASEVDCWWCCHLLCSGVNVFCISACPRWNFTFVASFKIWQVSFLPACLTSISQHFVWSLCLHFQGRSMHILVIQSYEHYRMKQGNHTTSRTVCILQVTLKVVCSWEKYCVVQQDPSICRAYRHLLYPWYHQNMFQLGQLFPWDEMRMMVLWYMHNQNL